MLQHYIKRILKLGPKKSITLINHKLKRKLFSMKWKRKALENNANHTWRQISNKLDFKTFFNSICLNNLVEKIVNSPNFYNFLSVEYTSDKKIFEHADKACRNEFDILGSGKKIFTKIPWKHDFKNNKKIIDTFYQEINSDPHNNESNPDIKIPWEISRFQHLFFLGKAHKISNNEKYSKAFVLHVDSWINENRFLIGVNWVCPMEVAIRSINWIFAFHFFKNSNYISEKFWKKFICSLYDHKYYLENNWEIFHKPNNHYISDLVGYFFLINVLPETPQHKIKHIFNKIIKQFFLQIMPDGTAYEGSTAYHQLDIELFWLFSLACQALQIPLPQEFHTKLQLGFEFLNNLHITEKDFVQIGDNDSGKILCGIKQKAETKEEVKFYPNFGLTIIRKNNFVITFRTPGYKPNQPTGHFHDDELSITLAYKNIPILVDPGSYVYTSNKQWRNLFRSYESHNTFYPISKRKISPSVDLFTVQKKIHNNYPDIKNDWVQGSFEKRNRKINILKDGLQITDWVDSLCQDKNFMWTMIFHPSIDIKKINNETWIILYRCNKILTLTSNLTFIIKQGFYSPNYGVIQKCKKLVYKDFLHSPKQKITTFKNSY